MATSDFNGTTIHVEIGARDASMPEWESQAYITARHIPGSSEDVVQMMGRGQPVISLLAQIDPTSWAILQTQLADDGVLTLAGVSKGICVLEAIAGPVTLTDGWVRAQLTFRKLGA